MLDYRVETFLTVCQTKNYTRAAEILNLTQPAVSQHIKYLEEYFGAKLFHLKGKQITITSRGEEVYQLAMLLKLNVEKFRINLKDDAANLRINMGATRAVGEYILGPIVAKYLKENPHYTLNTVIAKSNVLLEKVKYGEIDFAFVEAPFNNSNFCTLDFRNDRYLAVCSPDYELPKGKLTVDQLVSNPIILMEEDKDGKSEIEPWLIRHHCGFEDFSHIHVTNDIPIMKEMALNGIGIAFLYETTIEKELEQRSLIPIDIAGFNLRREFKFVYRKFTSYEAECLRFYDFCNR